MPEKKPQILYTYTVPQSVRDRSPNGTPLPEKVVMRALGANEEVQTSQVGRGNYMRAQYDAVKRALVSQDGKPLSYADGITDKFWEECGSVLRSLLSQAYSKITAPTDEEEKDFFASAEIQTG